MSTYMSAENPDTGAEVIDFAAFLLRRAHFLIRNPKVAVILLAASVLWAALHGWTNAETLGELVYEWEGLWGDLI